MFNVGGAEILVVLALALLVLGPERLPGAARQVGRALAELRRLRTGIERDVRDAMSAEDFAATKNALQEVAGLGATVKSELSSLATSVTAPLTGNFSAPVGSSMSSQREVKPAVASADSDRIPPPDGIFDDDRTKVDTGGAYYPTPDADVEDILVTGTVRSR